MKLVITEQLLRDINSLLEYNWATEQADYYENPEDHRPKNQNPEDNCFHIFGAMTRINNALKLD